MGAGILPTTIHKNKLYFLFGKENKFEDSAEGFSDFGGGTDNNEDYLQTAVREGGEEWHVASGWLDGKRQKWKWTPSLTMRLPICAKVENSGTSLRACSARW